MIGNMTWYIIGGLVLLLLIPLKLTYDYLVTLRHNSDEAFSRLDVYLKKRYNLAPNFVAIVKRHAADEQETLVRVTKARSVALGAQSIEEREQGDKALSEALSALFARVEEYPKLKEDTAFLNLHSQLVELEAQIPRSCGHYNSKVKALNDKLAAFPTNIIAKFTGFRQYSYFMADGAECDGAQRPDMPTQL